MPPLSRCSSSRKSASVLRRSNTVASSAPTKSEVLAPAEKQKQAMAAARRAFGEETGRRIRGSQSSAEMRPRLSEMNLNKLHLNRRPSATATASASAGAGAGAGAGGAKRPSTRPPPTTVAPPSTVDSSNGSNCGYRQSYPENHHAFSRASSTAVVAVDDDPRYYEFNVDDDGVDDDDDDDSYSSTSVGDYQTTVVRRRKSMQWHRDHLAPGSPRGRRDRDRLHHHQGIMALAELDRSFASPDYSPPQLGSSTPSSFRRVRKARSAFAVASQIFPPPAASATAAAAAAAEPLPLPSSPPTHRDIAPSSVVYAAERSPQNPDYGHGSDCYYPPPGPTTATTPNTRDASRKSMSFLRGGTEFMGEGRSRERRSYYMESSQRKGCPPIIPEAVGRYKGRNTKGEWGAVRCSVKKKARKISESVFGSVRRALGMEPKAGTGGVLMGTIPEQHIPSTRMHFRDYVTPEEVSGAAAAAAAGGGGGGASGGGGGGGGGGEQNLLYAAPGRFGSGSSEINNIHNLKEKPKIRSNYVISKPPTLHFVPSSEMIRSDVGSIRDLTPPDSFGRKFSATASIGTVSTGTWNSTIASRMTSRTLRGDSLGATAATVVDKRDLTPVLDVDDEGAGGGGEGGYFHPPPKRERRNVDARRVYSALVKFHREEDDRKAVQQQQQQPAESEAAAAAAEGGYYMTPGIGLLPEEEGIFRRHSSNNASPPPQSQSGRPPSLKKKGSDATIKPAPAPASAPASEPVPYYGSESPPPPPVPKIPRIWLENDIAKTFDEASARYPRGIQLGVPLAESSQQRGVGDPRRSAATTAAAAADKKESVVLDAGERHEAGRSSGDAIQSSTDAALSVCHLQQLPVRRRLTPRVCASNENMHPGPLSNKRLHNLEAGEGIRRSRSVLLEYHNTNADPQQQQRQQQQQRYERPQSRNVQLAGRAGGGGGGGGLREVGSTDENRRTVVKKASRASLASLASGRVSRMSVRGECDVGLAASVARQFGPVIVGQPAVTEERRFIPYGYGSAFL